jgi:hypothetical protein
MRGAINVVLDQDVVLEYRDLGKLIALSDDHLAYHRLAPGEELGLAQDGRAAPTCLATFPSPLPLGLHPSRSVDAGDFIAGLLPAGLAYPENGIHRVVRRRGGLLSTSAATTTAAARPLSCKVRAAINLSRFVLLRLLCLVKCGFV